MPLDAIERGKLQLQAETVGERLDKVTDALGNETAIGTALAISNATILVNEATALRDAIAAEAQDA